MSFRLPEAGAIPWFDITVGEPQKIGDVINPHIVYKVHIKVHNKHLELLNTVLYSAVNEYPYPSIQPGSFFLISIAVCFLHLLDKLDSVQVERLHGPTAIPGFLMAVQPTDDTQPRSDCPSRVREACVGPISGRVCGESSDCA